MSLTPQEAFDKIGEQLADNRPVKPSKMFGMLCLKVDKKAFAGIHEDAMAFKLTGADHEAALALPGAKLFDPSNMGRPMKEWVHVPFEHVARWPEFADAALRYVAEGK